MPQANILPGPNPVAPGSNLILGNLGVPAPNPFLPGSNFLFGGGGLFGGGKDKPKPRSRFLVARDRALLAQNPELIPPGFDLSATKGPSRIGPGAAVQFLGGGVGQRAIKQATGFAASLPLVSSSLARQFSPLAIAEQQSIADALPFALQNQLGLLGEQFGVTRATDAFNQARISEDLLGLRQLQDVINPEAAAVRSSLGSGLLDLLQPGLSGGERSEIERFLNRANIQGGTQFNPTSTSTVEAATTFGTAARNRFSQALELATQAFPRLQTGIGATTFNTGIATPLQASLQLPGGGAGLSFGAGGGLLQGIGQQQGQLLAANIARPQQPSDLERASTLIPDY
jgi:hypothetical protein